MGGGRGGISHFVDVFPFGAFSKTHATLQRFAVLSPFGHLQKTVVSLLSFSIKNTTSQDTTVFLDVNCLGLEWGPPTEHFKFPKYGTR